MLTAAGDREHVEQLEVVGVHHGGEALRGTVGVRKLTPLAKALLREARHVRDGLDAVGLGKVRVVSFGDKLDLVSEVEEPVVDGSRGEHQHFGAHAGLDHVLDEARVAVLFVGIGALVAKVVAFVDDEEVVVPPPQVLQVHVAAHPAVPGEVRVVEHRVGEAVLGERVPVIVVPRVEGPVLTQTLRAQDEHAGVALLVVLDDRERLEGLAQPHRVGDDAALVLLELTDGAHDGVPLEVVELVPDHGLLEFEARPDGVLLVLHVVAEQVVEREEVHEFRRVLPVERLELVYDRSGHVLHKLLVFPDTVEHRLEAGGLGARLEVADAGDDTCAPLVAQALQGEGVCC